MRHDLLMTLAGMGIDVHDPGIESLEDEQLLVLVSQLQGDPFAGRMRAKFAATPPGRTFDLPALKRQFAETSRAMTRRLGAIEQAVSGLLAGQVLVQNAARFSAVYRHDRSEQAVQDAIDAGQIDARDRHVWLDDLMRKPTVKFSAAIAELRARPAVHSSREPDAEPGDPAEDHFVQRAMQATPSGRRALAPSSA